MNIDPAKKPLDGAAIDRLIDAHRVLGESRMIRTDTPMDQVTEEQIADVTEQVRAYLKKHHVSQAVLAKALCVTPGVISQVLKGNYAADIRGHIKAMDRWLERRHTADEMPETCTFTTTAVVRRIGLAIKHAISCADAGLDTRIALIRGEPGCGKTWALKHIVEAEGGIFISCGDDMLSSRNILQKIAEALDCGVPASRAQAFKHICEKLRGSGRLIAVDEIHALLDARDDQPFHTLRRLADETGCPQVWSASSDLIETLQERSRKHEPLVQIISRICVQVHLTAGLDGTEQGGGESLDTVEKILEIFSKNELKLTRDAGEFLARLCTNPKRGLLRTCTSLVLVATKLNRMKAKEITPVMLWEACQYVFQASVMRQVSTTMAEELKELKRKIA